MRLPRAWRPPPVRVAGAAHTLSGGGGVAVVAVPGLGLSVEGWRACLTLLGAVDAVAVALPAFGLPARARLDLGPAASAQRLLDRLDALDVTSAVLVGHSASCQVVAELARRAPHRVRGLVLVGPSTDPLAASWPGLAGRWLRSATHEPASLLPLLVRDYTYSGLVSFARAMDASRRHRLDQALTGCPAPVLLVRGSLDRIAPQSWIERLAARCRSRPTVTIPGAAHMVPLTHPHHLAAALRPLIEEVDGECRVDGERAPRTGTRRA